MEMCTWIKEHPEQAKNLRIVAEAAMEYSLNHPDAINLPDEEELE